MRDDRERLLAILDAKRNRRRLTRIGALIAVLLIAGLLFGGRILDAVIILLAILSIFTFIQRVLHVRNITAGGDRPQGDISNITAGGEPPEEV